MLNYYCGTGWAESKRASTDMGADAYLCCPGPSLKLINPNTIKGKGRVVFGINTSYPYIKPDIWLGMDTIECYDRNILYEPFMKVFRAPFANSMEFGRKPVKEFPNVYWASVDEVKDGETMYNRRAHSSHFVWHKSTLMVAIHMMIWMGAKNIHLAGCDMGGKEDYYKGNILTDEQRAYNKRLYRLQVNHLKEIVELGKRHGVNFYSITPDSPINDYMPYLPPEDAIKRSENKTEVAEDWEVKHVLDSRKSNVLHITNWGIWGGVQSVARSIAMEYKEYNHKVFALDKRVREDCVDYYRKSGMGFSSYNSLIKEADVKRINPKVIFLHNTKKVFLENDAEWLKNYKVIRVHHGWGLGELKVDLDWFVSDFVYKKLNYKVFDHIILPPVTYAPDYLNVERDKDRPVVVGRVQSTTHGGGKPYPQEFYDILEKLDCPTFIVAPNDSTIDNIKKDADIVPGKTAEYLKEMDIFTIWQDKTETWGLAATEANLSGIPVVARRMKDGLTEQLEKSGGGILVNTKQGFIEAVQKLREDKDLRDKLAKQGKEWNLQNSSTTLLRGYLREYL